MGNKLKALIPEGFLSITLCFGFLLIVSSHDPQYQGKQEQCPIIKQEIDYIPHGGDFQLKNLSIYETADSTPKRLLIAVYDIFGDTANTRLFADLLGETYGFRVVVPDFYRGEPWDHNKWPPDQDEYAAWRERVTNWDRIVQYDIRSLLDYYKGTQNISNIGIFGFCWGGLITTLTASQMGDEIRAAGLVHPSSITNEMANDVKAPMYLFPCLDDPDHLPFYEVLQQKFGDNCGHRRYNDMCHGFATSMGNFSNPLVWQRVEQTIDILGNFFVRNMPNQ
jgi:dienelactone hydrolase